MAFEKDGYWYDQQVKNYILQFMAIFGGLQVQVGKWGTESEQLIYVPIHYAHPDRVVSAIMSENTQNKPIRLPTMSAYLKTFEVSNDRMKGTGVERRTTYTPVGGLVPNDTVVVHQRVGVPYDLEMELHIYVSNTDQHLQMIEQIVPLFDPQLQIEISDSLFDTAKLTSVFLTSGPVLNTNMPIGMDKRIIQSAFTFKVPIWIVMPAEVKKDFIEKIFLRIGAVDTSATTSQGILDELNAANIQYELVVDASDPTV